MNPTQPTQEQLNARIQDSGQTPVPQSAPPVSSTMQPEKFSQTPFQTPETPTQPDYMAAFASIPSIEQVQQATDSMVSAQTPAEKTQNGIADRLLAGYQKLTGKAGAQIKAEESAGLPQFNQQLNDINGQIKQLQATALANQEKALNSGETSSFAAGEAQRVGRNDAIKAMSLSAIASTLQGNIALAQQTADRAVELEFAPAQAEIDFLSKAYELNKDSLGREDKKRAEAQQILLSERQRLLDNQKEDKKTIIGFASRAAENGASSLLINNALKSTTPAEALSILSQFIPEAEQRVLGSASTGYFTYDPLTGKTSPLGGSNPGTNPPSPKAPKGSVTSGKLVYTPTDQTEDSQALESSRGEDGYVDPTVYQTLSKLWIDNGGIIGDFVKTFPPKDYINPANTWLPANLMPGGKKATNREI